MRQHYRALACNRTLTKHKHVPSTGTKYNDTWTHALCLDNLALIPYQVITCIARCFDYDKI